MALKNPLLGTVNNTIRITDGQQVIDGSFNDGKIECMMKPILTVELTQEIFKVSVYIKMKPWGNFGSNEGRPSQNSRLSY